MGGEGREDGGAGGSGPVGLRGSGEASVASGAGQADGETVMITLPIFWPASTYSYASTICSSG